MAETAGNGVWDLVGDANSDPMEYKSSKSAFWRRKIQFSVKSVNLGLFLAKVHYTYHKKLAEISAEWVAGSAIKLNYNIFQFWAQRRAPAPDRKKRFKMLAEVRPKFPPNIQLKVPPNFCQIVIRTFVIRIGARY